MKDRTQKPINKNSLRWKLTPRKEKIRILIKECNPEARKAAWERLEKALEELEKNKQ